MDIQEILKRPLDGSYSASVEVVLFSQDHKQICLVLEVGGKKDKGMFSYVKPKAWGNPGGGIHKGETPINGALRELNQETGFPKKVLKLDEEIVDYKVEGNKKPHYKFVLTGKVLCGTEEFPFEVNPAKDTEKRRFLPIVDLPSPKNKKYWKLDGFGIFPSHLDHILANQRPALT